MKGAQRALYHVARLVLAVVFVYAGAVKANDVTAFAGHVSAYQILPFAMNYLLAATLPYVEFLAGLLLLLNVRVRSALVVIGGMNLVFIVALISVLLRGLDIDCGCFEPGSGQNVSADVALMRDIGFMVLVVLIWWLRGKTTSRDEERGTRDA